MPDDDEEEEVERWWEQYGIDPAEATASVEAALVGDAIARQCAEDASAALIRTTVGRVVPFMKGQPQENQIALAIAVAGIFKNVATQYETMLKGLA